MSSSTTSQDQQPRQGHGEQTPVASKPRMKKQTRRRVHTSRPYQERLLNMAEARREIVTALRIHRANNMRQQQSEYQLLEQRQQPRLQQPAAAQVLLFQEQSQEAFQGVPPPVAMNYASSFSSSNNHHLCNSPLANLISGVPAGNYNSSSSSMFSYHLTPLEEEEEEEASAAAAIGGGQLEELLACSLPGQPLGLNLSFFQDFGNSLDHCKNSDDPFGVPLIQSSSRRHASSSYYSAYSSPVTAIARGHGYASSSSADAPAELTSQVVGGDGDSLYSTGGGGGGGERQRMELSEAAAANVAAASARWTTRILESMESGVGESAGATQTTGAEAGVAEDVVAAAAVAGWPEWQWLCDGDGVGVGVEREVAAVSKPGILETLHVDDGDYRGCYEGDHRDNGGHDISFPCMDVIGEIEGWDDGEWFP